MLDLRVNLRLHPQIQKLTCLFSPVKNKPLYQIRQYNSKNKVQDRHDNEEIVGQLDKFSPELAVVSADLKEDMSAEQHHRDEVYVFPDKLRYGIAGPDKKR